jgi:hypothetical protein
VDVKNEIASEIFSAGPFIQPKGPLLGDRGGGCAVEDRLSLFGGQLARVVRSDILISSARYAPLDRTAPCKSALGRCLGIFLTCIPMSRRKGSISLCPVPAFKMSDDSVMLSFAIATDCEALLPRTRFCAL